MKNDALFKFLTLVIIAGVIAAFIDPSKPAPAPTTVTAPVIAAVGHSG
jgi:hypothetical protein